MKKILRKVDKLFTLELFTLGKTIAHKPKMYCIECNNELNYGKLDSNILVEPCKKCLNSTFEAGKSKEW